MDLDIPFGELLRGASHQVIQVVDQAPDVIRLTTGRVADMLASFESDDLEVFVEPAGLAGRRHTGGITPDDDKLCSRSPAAHWPRYRFSSSLSANRVRRRRRRIKPMISSAMTAIKAVTTSKRGSETVKFHLRNSTSTSLAF
jgi:hypothetical protein